MLVSVDLRTIELVADCRHGMPASWCSACKHSDTVFTTSGGTRYHRLQDCDALADGQDRVSLRGGTPAAIERVTESRAMSEGRSECRTCRHVHRYLSRRPA